MSGRIYWGTAHELHFDQLRRLNPERMDAARWNFLFHSCAFSKPGAIDEMMREGQLHHSYDKLECLACYFCLPNLAFIFSTRRYGILNCPIITGDLFSA